MSTGHVKATVQVGEKTVIFEGPRDFVEDQVAKYTNLSTSKPQDISAGNIGAQADGVQSERELVQEKKPVNHSEIVAVLAFSLTQNGKAEFTDEDMRKAYIRAGVRPPKVVSQSIRDAKNKADFIEAGSKKGTYRLSPHGDRTVRFDLPRLG